jgi:hypothetical protein
VNRLQKVREATQGLPWQTKPEVWEVLSEDLREQEFEGTYEECLRYLKAQCPTGSCDI